MNTRAKFTCTGVNKTVHWDGSKRFLYTAEFRPVTNGSDENKKFFEATPSGQLQLGTFVEERFQPGKEYYLDFTEIG